jgi:hypothetical protein
MKREQKWWGMDWKLKKVIQTSCEAACASQYVLIRMTSFDNWVVAFIRRPRTRGLLFKTLRLLSMLLLVESTGRCWYSITSAYIAFNRTFDIALKLYCLITSRRILSWYCTHIASAVTVFAWRFSRRFYGAPKLCSQMDLWTYCILSDSAIVQDESLTLDSLPFRWPSWIL